MKLLIDTNVILDMVFERKGCDAAIVKMSSRQAGAVPNRGRAPVFYVILPMGMFGIRLNDNLSPYNASHL